MKGEQLTKVTPSLCNLCKALSHRYRAKKRQCNRLESVDRTGALIQVPKVPSACHPDAIVIRSIGLETDCASFKGNRCARETELVANVNPFKRRELADNGVSGRPLHFVVEARTNYVTTEFRGWAHEASTAGVMAGKKPWPPRLEARLVRLFETELHKL